MDPAVDPPATAEAHTAHAANATPTLNHTHNHPPYAEMITAAITTLDERKGSSRKAIAKYIEDNYTNLPSTHSALLTHHLKRLKNSGALLMVKHSYKLPRSASAPAQTPSSAKRSRGRPPKPKTDVKPTLVALGLLDEHDSPAKRTPGRPRKSGDSAAATPKAGSGRRPGRPPKTRALMALNSVESKKPRGRPRKEGSSPATVPSRPRGRPPRNAGVGGGDGGGVVGSRRGRALKAVAPKKPKKLGARPIGRPKKMTSNDGCDDSTIFIRILHEHVKKGELQTSTFDKKVWEIIENELFATIGKKYTPAKLKAKFNRLRLRHKAFLALLDQTGFRWDPQSNTVEANEDTWANYIKSHPNAKVFKKKGCEHYSILGEIFNTTTATGQLHHASTQEPPPSDEECDLEEGFLCSGIRVDIGSSAGDVGNADAHTINNEQHAKKDSKATKFESALDVWASHLSAESALSKAKVKHLSAKQDDACSLLSEPYSIDECMEMLNFIDGVSDKNYLRACEKFTDPNWRHMFIEMPTHRKKAWVNDLTSI